MKQKRQLGCNNDQLFWNVLGRKVGGQTREEIILRAINLTDLNESGNQLTSLPDSIGQLTNLRLVYVDNNQLTSLPDSIGQLTNLQKLFVDNNQLTSLPDSIGQLTNLQVL